MIQAIETDIMNKVSQQDGKDLAIFIHRANVAHFLGLLARETDRAKRDTLVDLLQAEHENEKARRRLTMVEASSAVYAPIWIV